MDTSKFAVRLTETAKIKMIDWLKANHKLGETMTETNFLHWETSAVESKNEGYAHIEISSFDSIQKRTKVLDFDVRDFDYEDSNR